MGWFSDVLGTIGLGDVGSFVDTAANDVSDFVTGGGSDMSDMSTDPTPDLTPPSEGADDLTTAPNGPDGQFSDTSTSSGSDGGIGGFGGSALKAVGSALSATAASNGGAGIKINQVTPHYLQTPLDTKGATGKANRAPVADPQAIWNQWEQRLTYFVGNKK